MDITSNGEDMPHYPVVEQSSGAGRWRRVFGAKRAEHHGDERDLFIRSCLQLLIVPCSVAAKRRKFQLLAASCLVPLSLGVSEPARAQVCTPQQPTPDPVTGNATCTGTFNSNINYNTINTPIHLTASGISVTSPGGDAVNAANSTAPGIFGADVSITANNATISNTSISGDNNTGLRIQSAGAATITAMGTNIDVVAATGTVSNDGILAIIEGNNPANAQKDVAVTWTGQHITVFRRAILTP
jgi:hypothetical protein